MNNEPIQQPAVDPRTICPLSDKELLTACHKAITDMCQKQRWQMTVPPDMSRDSDMLLSELCKRFERVSGEPDIKQLREKFKRDCAEKNLDSGIWNYILNNLLADTPTP